MSRHRSLRSLAIRGLIAGALFVLASGSGTVTTAGCSADLRDFYACDALAHAICGKWKDCNAISDEDACYKAELDALGGTSTSSRVKCLDKLDDSRKCLTDIQDLACDNKVSTLDACGGAKLNAAVADPSIAQVAGGNDAGPTIGPGTGTDGGKVPVVSADGAVSATATTETLIALETTQIVAVASDKDNAYWITDNGQLRQHSLIGGGITTTPVPDGATPPLEAAGGIVYFSRGNQLQRLTVATGSTQPVLGLQVQQLAATFVGDVVVATTPSNVVEILPSVQSLQNQAASSAGISMTEQGRAYWAGQSGTSTVIYTWEQKAGVSTRFVIGSVNDQPQQFVGAFFIDGSRSVRPLEGSPGGTVPLGSATIPPTVQVYGTDGTLIVGVRNDTELVGVDPTSGTVSTLGNASRPIRTMYVKATRDSLVWASSGSSPGVYRYTQ